jgi:hypothetical protein
MRKARENEISELPLKKSALSSHSYTPPNHANELENPEE